MSSERKLPSNRDVTDKVLERLISDHQHAYVQFLGSADSKVELISNGAAFEILEENREGDDLLKILLTSSIG